MGNWRNCTQTVGQRYYPQKTLFHPLAVFYQLPNEWFRREGILKTGKVRNVGLVKLGWSELVEIGKEVRKIITVKENGLY